MVNKGLVKTNRLIHIFVVSKYMSSLIAKIAKYNRTVVIS